MGATAAFLAGSLAMLGIACTDGAAAPTPAPSPTAPPTATTEPTPTAEPTPAKPRVHPGTLVVEPSPGACDAALRATARGFEPGEVLMLYVWRGLDRAEEFRGAAANDSGTATFDIPASELADVCLPGGEYVLEARIAGDTSRTAWPRAIYEVEQIGRLWVEPSVGGCDGPTEVVGRGEGLPAGMRMRLFLGGAEPLAHNFIDLGVATVAEDGTFAVTVTLPPSCGQSSMAVYGSDESGEVHARWRAVLPTDGQASR